MCVPIWDFCSYSLDISGPNSGFFEQLCSFHEGRDIRKETTKFEITSLLSAAFLNCEFGSGGLSGVSVLAYILKENIVSDI